MRVPPRSGRFSRTGRGESLLPEHFKLTGPDESFGAVPCVELTVDVARVELYRTYGYEKLPRYLRVGLAGGEEIQHLELPLTQWVVEPWGTVSRRGAS